MGVGCASEFLGSQDNALQGFDVRNIVKGRSLQLIQERLEGVWAEPFCDCVQPIDPAHNRLQHRQSSPCGGRIADQFWLVDGPVLRRIPLNSAVPTTFSNPRMRASTSSPELAAAGAVYFPICA